MKIRIQLLNKIEDERQAGHFKCKVGDEVVTWSCTSREIYSEDDTISSKMVTAMVKSLRAEGFDVEFKEG